MSRPATSRLKVNPIVGEQAHERPMLTQLDRFAEQLSLGLSPKEAAEAIGLKPQSGDPMLGRIRKKLGPQSC